MQNVCFRQGKNQFALNCCQSMFVRCCFLFVYLSSQFLLFKGFFLKRMACTTLFQPLAEVIQFIENCVVGL